MRLTREVRLTLWEGEPGPVANSWGGWPASGGIAPYVAVRVTVAGSVDPQTGYLCNIALLDRAVREAALPSLRRRWAAREAAALGGERVVMDLAPPLSDSLPGHIKLARLELGVTPTLAYAWSAEKPKMVAVTQTFEFSAAHRLYCADFSEEENRRIFGKCTNANGHGHNYLVEVTIEGEPDASGVVLPIGEFEQAVKRRVIDVFDHKHLNLDCPEFAALNPSVENITRVVWEKLAGAFGRAKLARVRVFETGKTVAEYCGDSK